MTRARQVTQAVAALRRARPSPSSATKPASLLFAVFADNGGSYHWAITDDDGATSVRSAGFSSYEEARRAAEIVQRGASRASFEGDPDPGTLSAVTGHDPWPDSSRYRRRLDQRASSETTAAAE